MPRAAVIGVGYLGQFHAEKYARIKDVDLIAVVDIREAEAKRVAKRTKCQPLIDYRQVLALGIDCASVVCDTSKHFEVAKWLLKNGIDVLLEKPMTTTVAQAQELIAIAESNNRILQVGHLERFNPAYQAIKERLNSPWFFEARRITPFARRGHDVDVVLDLMIHDIDLISHLVGKPLDRVEAVGIPVLTNDVDIANARLVFEGGAVANITASRVAFTSERTIRVFQPDLYMSLDFGKKTAKIYSKKGDFDIFGFPKISVHKENVEDNDALEEEIRAFVYSVENRVPPVVDGKDGLRALETACRVKDAILSTAASSETIEELSKVVNWKR